MKIDWIWLTLIIAALCVTAYFVARLFAPPVPCNEWAAGEFFGIEYYGENYQQRYDACMKEREARTP